MPFQWVVQPAVVTVWVSLRISVSPHLHTDHIFDCILVQRESYTYPKSTVTQGLYLKKCAGNGSFRSTFKVSNTPATSAVKPNFGPGLGFFGAQARVLGWAGLPKPGVSNPQPGLFEKARAFWLCQAQVSIRPAPILGRDSVTNC